MHLKLDTVSTITGSRYQQMSNSTHIIREFRFNLDIFFIFPYPRNTYFEMVLTYGTHLRPSYIDYQSAQIDLDLRFIGP